MRKLLVVSAILAVSVMLFVFPVMAHVHPLVPADECALGNGAGNTASPENGDNGQDFIGTGFIPGVNPGGASVGLPGHGVATATAVCANA